MSHSFSIHQDLTPKTSSGGATTQQPSGQQANPPMGGGGLGGMTLFLPLLMLGFIFFMNSRQKKNEEKERASLKRGDRVVSQSGLIGELVEFDDKFAKVNIAPGVKVQMLIGTISPMKGKVDAASTDAKLETKTPAVEKK